MAFDFKAAAVQATTLSPIMEGRDKLSIDDVIANFPSGVTLTGFDLIDGEGGKPYAVCICKDAPKAFFFGGSIMTKIAQQWASAFGDDPEKASAALAEQGGVKVQFSHGKTKNGNNLTLVKVL